MMAITARITVASDGTISGRAPGQVPAGEHEASITVADASALTLDSVVDGKTPTTAAQ
jgi:hypothetical protein